MARQSLRFEIHRTPYAVFYWKLVAGDGAAVASSTSFATYAECAAAIAAIRPGIANAPLVDRTTEGEPPPA